MTAIPSSYSDLHQQVGELLDFYVNGTLKGADLELVNQHLEGCVCCRRDLADAQEIRRLVLEPLAPLRSSQVDGDVAAAEASFKQPDYKPAFEKLLGQIEQQTAARGRVSWRATFSRLRRTWSTTPLRLALPLAAAMLLAAVGVLDQPTFWYTHEEPLVQEVGVEAVVLFQPGVSVSELERVLHRVDGQIVSGPDSAGFYRLHLGDRDTTLAAVDVLKKLQEVQFAGMVTDTEQ